MVAESILHRSNGPNFGQLFLWYFMITKPFPLVHFSLFYIIFNFHCNTVLSEGSGVGEAVGEKVLICKGNKVQIH